MVEACEFFMTEALNDENDWIISRLNVRTDVDLPANDAIASESFITEALEAAFGVFTLGILVAVVRFQKTLVDIDTSGTFVRLYGISFLATALVRS